MKHNTLIQEITDISKDLKVLYVEDDLVIQKKTQALLENIFLQVDVANDGEEGFITYQKSKYDLVVTDINMPKKDGIRLIKDIKSINQEQPIIITSAYDDSSRLLELISLGISSFVLKPMNFHSFFHAINSEVKKIHSKQLMQQHIIEQSKLAQMGEMVDAIAHQWKQPISAISLMAQAINYKIELQGEVPTKEILESNTLIQAQANHLIDTIDTFRRFFRPNPPMEKVSVSELVYLVKTIMKNTLISNDIDLELSIGGDIEIECVKNEFIHILINLVNNSKDVFNEKNITNKIIRIEGSIIDDNKKMIRVIDNGGGIPEEIIEDIFTPHFTTKEDGTGIGLYMSKQILKKLNGAMYVQNLQTDFGKGAAFCLVLS